MNILVINGSPKGERSNTLRLTNAFLEGICNYQKDCLPNIDRLHIYSMNDYGGDDALKNPIFIQTNRILTAAWGILYLITSIWTYFIMRTAAGSYIGIINFILPAIMGIFTAWFQKWYPRRIAKGN